MRIKIAHETLYRYQEPLRLAIQLMRLTPRSSDVQFVRRWRVNVDADARLDRGEDAFGNVTHLAFIDGPLSELRIFVEGEVETNDTGGFITGSVERVPETLFLRPTALTVATPEIRALARTAMAAEGGDRLACLHHLNDVLHRTMVYQIGSTTSATTAGAAFAAGRGVCQDFAHIFLAAARSIGMPARYVSGYYLRTDMTEQEAGHAWVEVHLAGLGWIAFDPTQGVCSTTRHLRVAIGADSNEAAPIRGARTGGFGEALSVSITVAPGRVVSGEPSQFQSLQQ